MKLPKKLKRYKELESEMTTVDLFMFNKINELRDYLSDKEASKGECKRFSAGDVPNYSSPSSLAPSPSHPPQQEESPKASDNPWLDKAHKMRLQAEEIMDKVNARINESPKEDEVIGRNWYFDGDELVITKGKWVIDRYKKHVREEEL